MACVSCVPPIGISLFGCHNQVCKPKIVHFVSMGLSLPYRTNSTNSKSVFLTHPKISLLIAGEYQIVETPKNSVKVRNEYNKRRMLLAERQLLFPYLFYWVHGDKRVKDADDVSRDHPWTIRLARLSGPRKVTFDRLHSTKALSVPHPSGILHSLERSSDQICCCEKEALGQTNWCQTNQ